MGNGQEFRRLFLVLAKIRYTQNHQSSQDETILPQTLFLFFGNGEWGMGNGEWGMGNGELRF